MEKESVHLVGFFYVLGDPANLNTFGMKKGIGEFLDRLELEDHAITVTGGHFGTFQVLQWHFGHVGGPPFGVRSGCSHHLW